jgi:hypothetical protein
MADFSKQWCELNDPEMPWDFDIIEIASKLTQNFYMPYICEGFGFSAIGKFADDVVKVYIRNWDAEGDEQPGEWITLDNLIKRQQNELQ